jgi:hypothetical protein
MSCELGWALDIPMGPWHPYNAIGIPINSGMMSCELGWALDIPPGPLTFL